MNNIVYLAVLEPNSDGGYGIFFPDLPGCISYSNNLTDAMEKAEEAASLHIYGLEEDHEPIPEPSLTFDKKLFEGNLLMPVTIHPDLYRAKRENERVKTNITLPAWLKREAEKKHVNFSRLMENSLLDYLKIPQNYRTL